MLNRMGQHEEALGCYQNAISFRDWTPALELARAFRGKGYSLIDLGRLDEAKAAYQRALELEPNNETAQKELDYITHGQNPQAKASGTLDEEVDRIKESFQAFQSKGMEGLLELAKKRNEEYNRREAEQTVEKYNRIIKEE